MNLYYCVSTGMMRKVFSPCPPGMRVLFSGSGWVSWLCFSPSAVISLKSEDGYEWSTLPLFSKFSGDLKLLKVRGWATALRRDAYRACARADGGRWLGALKHLFWLCGQLTHDTSPRLISLSCRGRQDQRNAVWWLVEWWSEGWKERRARIGHVVTCCSGRFLTV